MESSYNAKLTLLETALSRREQMTDYYRKSLFEGIFWLVDLIESDIVSRNDPRADYCLAYVHEIKVEAERCFKDGGFVDADTVMRCCTKLLFCLPDAERP